LRIFVLFLIIYKFIMVSTVENVTTIATVAESKRCFTRRMRTRPGRPYPTCVNRNGRYLNYWKDLWRSTDRAL
jgi:hypothetical protein